MVFIASKTDTRADSPPERALRHAASRYWIIAKNIDSTMSDGSGVAIDIEAIATACHTLRRAPALTVEVGGKQAHAMLVAADADKDV